MKRLPSGSQTTDGKYYVPDGLTVEPWSQRSGASCIRRADKGFYAMSVNDTGLSGSRPRRWGPKATIVVATGPPRDTPEFLDSLVYDHVAFGPSVPHLELSVYSRTGGQGSGMLSHDQGTGTGRAGRETLSGVCVIYASRSRIPRSKRSKQ